MTTPKLKLLLGTVAACGACCAIPVIMPFVLGAAAAGAAWKIPAYGMFAAAILVCAALFIIVRQRRRKTCNL